MDIIPLSDNTFGAEIKGLDLNHLSDSDFSALYEIFLTYGFFLIRGQLLDESQQIDFGKRFGALEFGALPLANQIKNPTGPIRMFSRRIATVCWLIAVMRHGIPTRPTGL